MYINIATDLTVMARNTDYKPNWVNDAPLLQSNSGSPYNIYDDQANTRNGNGHYDNYPIFRIQIAKNSLSTGYVRLWLWNSLTYTDVLYTAFKEGSTYDMYVCKYTLVDGSGNEITSQDANFVMVGYKGNTMPMNLM